MKLQRTLLVEEFLRMKPALLGRKLEHIQGTGNLAKTDPTEWELWKGRLCEIAIVEYTGGILLALKIQDASRLVSLRRGSFTTESAESCEFEFSPFEFQIYEWDNGDISFQSGPEGLDDLFLIEAPHKLLYASLYHF